MTRPPLNADQQQAVKAVAAFIVGPDKEYFLTGRPGVGKTFTTEELVKVLLPTLENYEQAMGKNVRTKKQLFLTSTTNKAAAVLSEQTGMAATTIHSFLGVVPQNNLTTGRTTLKKTNNWQVHFDKIIFVDEASMVDNGLYQLIQEATNDSCKIIYIGDRHQLAPVMEKISPAVELADNPRLHYEITTPVRNANSQALMDLCSRLQSDIINERPKENLSHWKAVPGEIIHLSGDELKALIDNMYGPGGPVQATDEGLACRILAFTNKTVIGYNEYIRDLRRLPSHPVAGETMVCNKHFQLSKTVSLSVEEDVHIRSVEGPVRHELDMHNSLSVFRLEISTAMSGSYFVLCAESSKDFQAMLSHYKRLKNWKLFYQLQETIIDLRNREASTVYKAQGSTYESVIMIMDDIFTSTDINQVRRMLYVGASRAKKTVYVYDKNIHTNARGIY